MATNTPILQLRKPAATDNVDVVTDIADNMDKVEALHSDVSAAWVPVFTSIVLGNGTVLAKYKEAGKFVYVEFLLTFGSTTTIAANSNISLPVASKGGGVQQVLMADFFDVSADVHLTASAILVGTIFAPVGSNGRPTNTVPFIWATGDQITVSGWYERS